MNNRSRSKKTGLPPGTLLHVGEQPSGKTRITVMRYNDGTAREEIYTSPVETIFRATENEVHWIHVEGVHDAVLVDAIGNHYGLHPLLLEDIMHTEQRVKIEDYGDHLYLVMKIITLTEKGEINSRQLSLILTRSVLISFTDLSDGDIFRPLRDRIHSGRGRLRHLGADYLFYTIMDFVVDQYFPILDAMEEKMGHLESRFDSSSYVNIFQDITEFNSRILDLSRWIRPAGDVVIQLRDMESDMVSDQVLLYLRDVHDHALRITETLEMFKDSVATLFNMHITLMGHKLNEIMKVLTIMATIFIPLTFVVGVYGMNFHYMPGLESPWGFHITVVFMTVMVLVMILWFKKKNIL